MSLAIDWSTVVVLFIANGLVDCILVAYLAGRQSKKKLVRYLESDESKPLVDKITAQVAEKVLEELPNVPTVEQIISELPPYPDVTDKLALFEERMGAKLTASMDSKWGALQEQLSARMGQVVQANIASAKASFARANAGLEESMSPDNDGSLLTEVLGIFMDEDSIKKVSRAKRLFSRFQQGGGIGGLSRGGQAPQGGYPYGTIMNGHVATPNGWVPIAQAPKSAALPAPPASAQTIVPIEAPPELPPEPKAA